MEFSRPEYWSGYPVPSPGDLPNSRIGPRSPALQGDFYQLSHQGSPNVEMLQDLVLAAVNEALRTATETTEREMSKLTGGISMPGLF